MTGYKKQFVKNCLFFIKNFQRKRNEIDNAITTTDDDNHAISCRFQRLSIGLNSRGCPLQLVEQRQKGIQWVCSCVCVHVCVCVHMANWMQTIPHHGYTVCSLSELYTDEWIDWRARSGKLTKQSATIKEQPRVFLSLPLCLLWMPARTKNTGVSTSAGVSPQNLKSSGVAAERSKLKRELSVQLTLR